MLPVGHTLGLPGRNDKLQRAIMDRNDILQIATRLKNEGRAISPVSVCLEAYGQQLPEIAETLQQWRGERLLSVDALREDLPIPADLREVMRDAIDRFWSAAQHGVRGQVSDEIQALRERAQEAERETGMLYMDLTRTLSEVESCKRKIADLQHGAAQRNAPFEDVSESTPTHGHMSNGHRSPDAAALPDQSHERFGNGAGGIESGSGDWPLSAAAHDIVEARQNAANPDTDRLAEKLAAAEARVATAEEQVRDLEAKLANAREPGNVGSTGPQGHDDMLQRMSEMENAFARERQMLHAKLQECALQSAQWKQQTDQLKNTIEPLKQHSAWLNAQAVGRNALTSRLLEELRRVDPDNELLREPVRQRIIAGATEGAEK